MQRTLFLILLIISSNVFVSAPVLAATPTGVDAWAYQLQGMDIDAIRDDPSFQLIVIDYSTTGGEDGEFTPAQIAEMKSGGKTLIAYISIGEAEDYRYYWDPAWATSPPPWLGPENPDWPGNYNVRYWFEQWQTIIKGYLDRIVAQGFDGIYMDLVEAYYYWADEVGERPTAEVDMIEFVSTIRDHLAVHHNLPLMVMIPQNAEYIILENDTTPELRAEYLSAIDAIGVEDVFFFGDLDENNSYNPDQVRLDALDEYQAAGKCVYSVEYLTDQEKIDHYDQVARGEGFYPHATVRPLDILSSGRAASYAISEVTAGGEGQSPMTVQKGPAALQLEWSGVCAADFYNLYQGTLGGLRLGSYDHICQQGSIPATRVEILPGAGSYYYLVSAQNELGESGLGKGSVGSGRPPAAPCVP